MTSQPAPPALSDLPPRRPAWWRRAAFAVAGTRRRVAISSIVAVLLAVCGVIGTAYVIRELRLRRAEFVADKWGAVLDAAAQQDVARVREALAVIDALAPGDPDVARWRAALDEGRADPGDLVQ